jgi:ribosome biogenesis GTPase
MDMDERIGLIIRGINNIFSVIPLEELPDLSNPIACRIKGKVLSNVEAEYNPLAVGDKVLFNSDKLILKRLDRKNSFQRWNAKGQSNQTLVANVDLVIIVTSSDEPPFRPRFVDRAIVCSQNAPILIVLNKNDFSLTEEQQKRFDHYKELGYETLQLSAFNEAEVAKLKEKIVGKTVALIGQSGVGKSTLVNALLDDENLQRTGSISKKYQRGRHVTRYSIMLNGDNFLMIDTPGMRELLIPHTEASLIADSFVEFREYAKQCAFQSCLHKMEPNCKVKEAVEKNLIHHDRYVSYLRMLDSLEERPESWQLERR